VTLPRRRLAGVGVLLIAVLCSEHLLGAGRDGTGLLGEWLSALLIDLFGPWLTVLLLVVSVAFGVLLLFNANLRLPRPAASPSETDAAS
jgi:hypothetical protein